MNREQGLEKKGDWYQRLLKTMNEGFSIRDENTHLIYVNDKFCEMLGYDRKDLIGRPIAAFVAESDLSRLKEQLEKRKQNIRGTYELTWLRKDKKKLYTIMSAAPLFDDIGRFKGGFGAMTDITPRKLAEKKLLTYQSKLRSLASELSLAEERERRRIAGELHDRIGQTLAMAKIKLGALQESADATALIEDIKEIRAFLEQAISDTRSLTLELSPPILYELGFEAAVEWLTEQVHRQHQIPVRLENDGLAKPLDGDVGVLLFKVIQELLFNIVKHAEADEARLTLKKEDDMFLIRIEDNGIGFDAEDIGFRSGAEGGFGLFSIRERLNHLGGRFDLQSRPGKGTRVILSVPLKLANDKTLPDEE
jgi:PAS domain S-box-containing protein